MLKLKILQGLIFSHVRISNTVILVTTISVTMDFNFKSKMNIRHPVFITIILYIFIILDCNYIFLLYLKSVLLNTSLKFKIIVK